jgi:uncharacterized protein (TIGR01244 family)
MKIVQLTTQVSVSDQIVVEDVQALLDDGIELLVCNRPDGEDVGQTEYADIEAEANRLGLEIKFQPFSSYQIKKENRDDLIELIRTRKRLHLYCRSGSRCERLWREANAAVGGELQFEQSKQSA